jgi:hypothetical protein
MKKLLLSLVFAGLLFGISFAQSNDDAKAKIDMVLMNDDLYIYGNVTDTNSKTALKLALDEFQNNLGQYLSEKGLTSLNKDAFSDKIVKIEVPRGDQWRAFVYVKKSDLTSTPSAPSQISQSQPTQSQNVPPVARPEDKEPVAVKPPVTETTQETQREPEKTEPTPTHVEPKPERVEPKPAQVEPARAASYTPSNNIEESLLAMSRSNEVMTYLDNMKKNNIIADYNRYAPANGQESYYVVLYKRTGEVVTILAPGGQTRKNLQTNEEDSLSNHPGCGTIWFKIK